MDVSPQHDKDAWEEQWTYMYLDHTVFCSTSTLIFADVISNIVGIAPSLSLLRFDMPKLCAKAAFT